MTALQLLWFLLLAVLFIGFFFLDGFDFGVGMATRLLAHDEAERTQLVSTIGPHWDGNEVWLITAGGAMFASYPLWYASLFSGFYLLFFLVLVGLIIRGVAFEFAAHAETERGRSIWRWALFFGSIIPPFFLGMIFTAIIQPLPIDQAGNVFATFGNQVNLLTIVGGVAVVLMCLMHGLNFIRLKTEGPLRQRARALNAKLAWVLYAGEVVFAALVFFMTDFFKARPVSTTLIVVLIVVAAVAAHYGAVKDRELLSFISSGAGLALVVALIFNGLFPRVMIGVNPAHSILIQDASASPLTLTIMTVVTCILLPIALGYFIWSYVVFHKRVAAK
ncbi:MAG: cytochrome d ubiquinol oxidase subunit II [Lactobacillus sp.]|jgi:cytochrome d ubiquinol oxidase subunit II|uniref:Cytochrome d ubiquinol oxidase subunit II n=1 Tax=Lacticaseibacillus suilingensis TaxID=2799577 RepID=A0ABW4BEK6_9LACO|nr:cytochrome d ubiquinol oxidase subunit II [Lacticaseibacillus suilingensis]MCI1893179.1 cytochrome d ubiquinol oxidase subunit II [Lactobacillus sp.]MCI1918236.1 cytochrome d ubiquinol oxidase subunit II [Lactobacillus sp.]MCI1940871.1 cytochrome d ubiquinol oxidase subunit II [Lactobacillus sp.]MCI1971250.1 cytochrome d ubiquinol oxidase subunit II [Lactobacillus sp.]MCI2017589.1 cytochrome d ubiquinol oxidase subunit II [Lactobacillus sp.]